MPDNNGLIIKSIDTDNRITAQFSDKYLPSFARHGELFVVDGILYIYADLDDSNHGRWFPLTDKKEIYTYEQPVADVNWVIPIDFHTDNLHVVIYDEGDKIFRKDFDINIDNMTVNLVFSEPVSGEAYIIVNKAFDWIDKRFVVADKNFAVEPDETLDYYLEINTKHVEILRDGNVTFRQNVTINGNLTVDGDTYATIVSDERDKTNIVGIEWGLSYVEEMKPVTFSWDRRDGEKVGEVDVGFIAQDLDELERKFNSTEYTQLVNKDDSERFKINILRTYPILVKAIQELSTQNKQLMKRIEQLENKNVK